MAERVHGLKWNYYDDDVIPAWVAEIDFELAPAITSALRDAVEKGITGYPFPAAEQATFEAAVGFWERRLNWSVDPKALQSAPDVIEGTRRSIERLTRPDAPVILHTPVYFPFFDMIDRSGRKLIEVESYRDDEGLYRLDFEGIDKAFASGAGSIVLCNPWNPTGRVLERSELETLVSIARSHEARVISDEIHAPITYGDHRHTPIATIDPDVVVTVTSASKVFDLPGLKSAQVVLTNEDDREPWRHYFANEKAGVGTLGLIASTAAYGESDSWLDETIGYLDDNRRLLAELLESHAPGVSMTELQGTYLSWLDFSDYGLDTPSGYLLKEAKVALTSGEPFGGSSTRFARLNLATTSARLEEIVDRMGRALERL